MSELYKTVEEEDGDEWTLHQDQDLLKCTLLRKLPNRYFMHAGYVGVMNSHFKFCVGAVSSEMYFLNFASALFCLKCKVVSCRFLQKKIIFILFVTFVGLSKKKVSFCFWLYFHA